MAQDVVVMVQTLGDDGTKKDGTKKGWHKMWWQCCKEIQLPWLGMGCGVERTGAHELAVKLGAAALSHALKLLDRWSC